MKQICFLTVAPLVLLGFFSFTYPAGASVRIGTGDKSLLGGDLTDPNDSVREREPNNYAHDKSEDELRPLHGNWLRMKSAPTSPRGTAPHQRHAYQSWQGSPACAIFLNKPVKRKWYVSFRDGGKGGPTKKAPYFCAVELKGPFVLTHFTLTTAADMPGRDPKSWAIQGSNSGNDDDWIDIYKCDRVDRSSGPFQVKPRSETTLFTAFTSANMAKVAGARDGKKIADSLKDEQLKKADFVLPTKAYTWFRIVIYSCYNPNSKSFRDFNRPPGFSLGQLELFGVPGSKKSAQVKESPADKTGR